MARKTFSLQIAILLIICLKVFCEGQEISEDNETVVPRLPLCCDSINMGWIYPNVCYPINIQVNFNHTFFEDTDEGYWGEGTVYPLTYFKPPTPLPCPNPTPIDDISGFTYEGDLKKAGPGRDYYKPANYCLFTDYFPRKQLIYLRGATCVQDIFTPKISKGQIYFPCIVFSTMCYFFAAIIYKFILKVHDGHKNCFIAYSLCMGTTFLFLILLQQVDTACEFLGSVFFLSMLASFVWLFCLCFDVIYVIQNFKSEDTLKRLYLYALASVLIPSLLLIISLVPHGIPDIPISFLKEEEMCTFKGLLLLSAIGCLVYSYHLIAKNRKIHKSDIIWLEKEWHFNYMSRSSSLIVLTSAIWVIDAGLENIMNFDYGDPLVYAGIEGLQGIFVLSVFVFNRYNRREIYKTFFGSDRRSQISQRFNKLLDSFNRKDRQSNIRRKRLDIQTSSDIISTTEKDKPPQNET